MSNEKKILTDMAKSHNAFPLHRVRSIAARLEEREARLAAHKLGEDEEPGYELVLAPGCHGEPFPPTVGWVWTQAAAEDLAGQKTHMPDGSSHNRLRVA